MPLRTAESNLGTGGLKRTLDAAEIERAVERAMHPSRTRALGSLQHQQAAYAGWVQSEIAAARELSGAASMATAALSAAQAVIESIPTDRDGERLPVLAEHMSAFLLAASNVQASLNASAQAHVVRGYAAMVAARDAGAARRSARWRRPWAMRAGSWPPR